ncbi:MAG: hypothetical protein U1E25_14725 [Methylocystis sp.]
MPANLRCHYTEGQRAVLCIIKGEVKHHGLCDLPIGKIAALAGVCRTTVQTTLHEARRLGHIKITERPRPGRKNLTNVIHRFGRMAHLDQARPERASARPDRAQFSFGRKKFAQR